ncbi:MAG: glucosidase [Verrucomicrobiae bacterium]|nr:glucosidase [Verrucomicrobiae bacterium]
MSSAPGIIVERAPLTAEELRLAEDARRLANWKRWGPYLAERQWATVREDYSADGDCWNYFPHDHARSRAYRWGEDGLLGVTDRECRFCFAVALWNERDPILKERLFGLTNGEGNHGEDVKECYYYLDALPTSAYLKALYKYPQREFPYRELVEENRRRSLDEPEFELLDTGVFDDDRYFDVVVEYAKAAPDDVLARITVTNRGPVAAPVHVLPTFWYRNTWSWGCRHEGCWIKPRLRLTDTGVVVGDHVSLGRTQCVAEGNPVWLFTENETNFRRLFGVENVSPYVKDAFHEFLVAGRQAVTNPRRVGTKAAAHYRFVIPPGGEVVVRVRWVTGADAPSPKLDDADEIFAARKREADEFYAAKWPVGLTEEERNVARQAYAGLLWSRQFYHYIVRDWLEGDPAQPPPPADRWRGRNREWVHLFNRDVVSVPDKWEYPWYAAWDLAFHMIPMARVDPQFAKDQLVLFLREWYMHPNGQLPAYEFALGDVNPPVHAWACWRVYKMTGERGQRDRVFLSRTFQKLVINFTWWVNRKDAEGKNIFGGGFLGLDNVGVFDRSQPLPGGSRLEQADATAWMAFFCGTMLAMALELARDNPATEDMASKFFEHFVAIADAMNSHGGTGLWDEEDGFYYDQLFINGRTLPMRLRSLVGLIPLIAVEVLEEDLIERLPGFCKRMRWFLENRKDLARHISYMEDNTPGRSGGYRLLAIPSRERLVRVLRRMLDENEFLSPYGIRSLSKVYETAPYELELNGQRYRVGYEPGESRSRLFGGNSNWRGPVWLPINYLLIEALERYHHFYGNQFTVEYPTGSGRYCTLQEVATDLAKRIAAPFLPDEKGYRPIHGEDPRYARDPNWRRLVLFYEYLNGDNGRGCGASHQTGWTALVARCLEACAAQATRVRTGEGIRAADGSGAKSPRGNAAAR